MNILFISTTHLSKSLNGAEMYHHNLAKELQKAGHDAQMMVDVLTYSIEYDGVWSHPLTWKDDLMQWANIIICKPGRMRRLIEGKTIIFMQHNAIKEPWSLEHGHVVYCANHVAEKVNYKCKSSTVFYPFNRYAGCEPLPPNPTGKVTLVNCNNNKGGYRLIDYAKALPDVQFLGITEGYSHQIKGDLPNLEYRHGGYDLKKVLKDTSVLIMPSDTEGMPTLALEAMSLGIPVLGSNIPAFLELGLSNKTGNFIAKIIDAIDHYGYRREWQFKCIADIESTRKTSDFIDWIISRAK